MSIKRIGYLAAVMLMCALSTTAMAQVGGNGGGGGGGAGGGGGGGGGFGGGGGGGFGGRFDPAQMRQRMMDQLKQDLGSTDDEFAALQPKIEKVFQLTRDANGPGMRGMFGRRGGGGFGPPPGGADQAPSATQQAIQDLQDTLDDQNASADQIKTKLEAYRQAKAKAKEDLVVAQKDLQAVLTQRQEAVLVMRGLLD